MDLKETFIGLLKEARSTTADYSKEVVKKVDQIKATLKGHESAKHTKIINAFLEASDMMKYWKEQEASYKVEAKNVFPELFDTEEMGAQLTIETVSTTLTLVARAKKNETAKTPTTDVDYEAAFEELYTYVLQDLLPRLQKFDSTMKQLDVDLVKETGKIEKIKSKNTTTTTPPEDPPFDFNADLQSRRLTVKARKESDESNQDPDLDSVNESISDVWAKIKKWFTSKFSSLKKGFDSSKSNLSKIKSKFKI